MTKKELPTTIRQMHGFSSVNPAKMHTARELLGRDEAKDKLIAELRASLAQLEATEAARKAKQRDRTAKVRAKK